MLCMWVTRGMLWLKGLASGYFAKTDIIKFYIAFAVETVNTECEILGLKKFW